MPPQSASAAGPAARWESLRAQAEEALSAGSLDEAAAKETLARLDAELLAGLWEGALARAERRGRARIAAAGPFRFYRRALADALARRGAGSPEALRALFHPAWGTRRLVLFVTHACQLRCAYCTWVRWTGAISDELVDKAIAALLDTLQERVQVHFFGGEPLLRWPTLRRAVLETEAAAARAGKRASFYLSTNALALDDDKTVFLREHGVRVEASLHGEPENPAWRPPLAGGRRYYESAARRLALLREAGLEYHVTSVVMPHAAARAAERFRWLAERGHRRIQLNYAQGQFWPRAAAEAFEGAVTEIGAQARAAGAVLLNLERHRREPAALNAEVVAGCDGLLYHKSGLYYEGTFDDISPIFVIGPLGGCGPFDRLEATRFDNLSLFLEAYAEQPGRLSVILNNIALGARLGRLALRLEAAA